MRTALLALAALVSGGCSSHYMPRSHGRVAVTMVDGKPMYVRDGNMYEHGMLGGGLVQAVAGNRAAESAALEYHDHMRDGLLEMLLGTAAMFGGLTYAAVQAADNPDHPKVDAAPIIVGLAGMVIMLYGASELASAEPYRWDAINLFNDGNEATPPGPTLGPPGYGATAQAKATLHMRD
jgi:hypothetical protein